MNDLDKNDYQYEDIKNLLLDENNPRFGNMKGDSEQSKVLDLIVNQFGVDDVLSSLAINGYFESEPLICEQSPKEDKFIVKEGNRRLSACMILCGDKRAENHQKRITRYKNLWEENGKPSIDPIPIIVFPKGDKKVLSYLGVRHIASTQPWDSYAKAAWVSRAVEESGFSLSKISQMIGDQSNTISRLLEGYYLIQQLRDEGYFRPSDSNRKGRGSMSEYPFSWVYTILSYVTVREFLEITENQPTKPKPLRPENLPNGELVLESMFGNSSRGKNGAIDDSRQLGKLAKVFSDKEKIRLLRQGKNIDEIEDLTKPIVKRLVDGLGKTKDILRTLIAGLAEHGLSQDEAESLLDDSNSTKKLAIKLDRNIRESVFENPENE